MSAHERMYRLLLRAYPEGFRLEYGREMEQGTVFGRANFSFHGQTSWEVCRYTRFEIPLSTGGRTLSRWTEAFVSSSDVRTGRRCFTRSRDVVIASQELTVTARSSPARR